MLGLANSTKAIALKSMLVTAILAISLVFWLQDSDPQLPPAKVNGIVFLDSNHGFVQQQTLPQPEAYETFDGGRTWKLAGQGVPGFRTGRSFATNLRGWSIDEKSGDDPLKWTVDTIHKTEDGGRTWQVSLKTNRKGDFAFGGIQAISETEVWVVGISGTYHTTDGGKTWEKSGPPGTGLQFLDAHRGWIQGDKLWRTENGGRTWKSIDGECKPFFGGFGFFFLDDQHGWAVSGRTEGNTYEERTPVGHVKATTDGGKTCSEIARLPGQLPWSVFFLNEREGWAGGIGSLLKTEDGGRTWSVVSGK